MEPDGVHVPPVETGPPGSGPAAAAVSGAPAGDELREELQAYYRPLLPLWDRTLAGRGDRDFWRRAAEEREGRAGLELGAGSGRVTEVLAGRLRPLVGLDLNLEALRRARRRLTGRPRVHLLMADMRRFRLDARFSLVVAANDPFSHLRSDEGRSAALRRVAEHLSEGGAFVLDALWFPEEWRREASGPGGKTLEHSPPASGDESPLTVRHTWRCDPGSARCTARFECRREGEVEARSVFVGRYWTRDELRRRFEHAGLAVERVWGDYDRGRWRPDSRHLVVEATPR